jgi:hypothetical protein
LEVGLFDLDLNLDLNLDLDGCWLHFVVALSADLGFHSNVIRFDIDKNACTATSPNYVKFQIKYLNI